MKKLILLVLLTLGCTDYNQITESLFITNKVKDANDLCRFKINILPEDQNGREIDGDWFIEKCNFGELGQKVKITNIDKE